MKTVLVVRRAKLSHWKISADSLLEIDPSLEIVGVQTAMEALEMIGNRKNDNPQKFDGISDIKELPE